MYVAASIVYNSWFTPKFLFQVQYLTKACCTEATTATPPVVMFNTPRVTSPLKQLTCVGLLT